ncbi:MOSC domain-containing protein [Frondihabitans sp. 762G35]|uniref:MOSC domain-containing protein n=1 Tax=Frondihabitans sp. 762G35 TaxID=1446794 RepID=UPI000E7069BE|nr:MOSC domain-containing protein [Frondihabitans sp. 762G35]
MTSATVVAVSRDGKHRFSKPEVPSILLREGWGIEGDAHAGVTVQHRSRLRRDPDAPNLRQVHLIHAELLDEVEAAGFPVEPGQLGENVTTRGIDLLGLATDTLLRIGPEAVVRVTGLRNPCVQIDGFEAGLLKQLVGRDETGAVVRKGGVMSVVVAGGAITPGDAIVVEPPEGDPRPLLPV